LHNEINLLRLKTILVGSIFYYFDSIWCTCQTSIKYDVLHIVVHFLLYLNYENYMKLLNYYGDVVGVYICYAYICCWWIFLHAIGVELLV